MQKGTTCSLLGLGLVFAVACGGSSDSDKKETSAGAGGESAGETGEAGSEQAGDAGSTDQGGLAVAGSQNERGGQSDRGGAGQGGRGGAGGSGQGGGRAGSGGVIPQAGGATPWAGGTSPTGGGVGLGGSGNAPSQGGNAGNTGDGGSAVEQGGSSEVGGEGDGGTGDSGGWVEAGGEGAIAGAAEMGGMGVGGEIGPGGMVSYGGWIALGGALPYAGGPSMGAGPDAGGAIEVTVPLPEVELPANCSRSYLDRTQDYCSTEFDCGDNYAYINCSVIDQGRASCWCEGNRRGNTYELAGVVAGDSCDYIAALCLGSVQPPSLSTEECQLSGRETSTTSCSSNYTCTQSGEIVEGASLVASFSQYYSCWQDGEQPLTCDCFDGQGSMGVNLPEGTPMAGACTTLRTICTSSEDITYLSQPSCTFSSESAYQTNCYGSYTCSRDAQLGDTSLQINEALDVNCNQNPEVTSEWGCSCSLGLNVTELTVTPEDPWETCSESMTQCLTELTAEE